MSSRTLVDFAAAAFREHPNRVLVLEEAGRQEVTAAELDRRSLELAAALVTYGLTPGARVAVLTEDGGDALLGSLAALRAGGTLVPLDPGTDDAALLQILAGASVRQALVADAALLRRILAIRPDLPELDLVLLFRESGEERAAALTVAGACTVGADALAREPGLLPRRAAEGGQAPAVLRTRADAEILLTHENALAAVEAAGAALCIERDETVLSALPAADAAQLALALACLGRGARLAHVSRAETLGPALLDIGPEIAVLPRALAGTLRSHIESAAGVGSRLGRRLLRFAARQGSKRSESDLSAGRLPSAKTWGWRVADALVIRRIREATGGRLSRLVSLGEPLPAAESEFFLHLGVPFLEGLALPEAGGLVAVNRADGLRAATAGRAVPGLEARFRADGILELRGSMVPGEGWRRVPFRGRIDGDGYLTGSIRIPARLPQGPTP
jgi:long-chain acyl-CoA synthetase